MLKPDIGTNAGQIWHLLESRGALPIRKIGELTNVREVLLLMSLGWLAREDKVLFLEKEGDIYVELNHSTSEMYY